MTFAENEEAKSVNKVETYDMSVNMRKLSVTLGLTTDQMEAVENVHNYFNAEMQLAAHADEADRKQMVKKAVDRDIKGMRYVLDQKQYRTYLMLLNTTLNNRGLNVNE
jgi:predicted NodU family carbamoyl transferase